MTPQSEPVSRPSEGYEKGQDEDDETTYPEGGWIAWSVVLGSCMSCFGSMGLMNSLGIFRAYLENHVLQNYSSGKIGWIFGLYAFLAFFCGIQIVPIFDARGPRILIICGGIGTVLFLVFLSFCTA